MALDETTPSPDFVKGFNEGYVLTQQLPELAEKLAKAVEKSDRSDGFQEGRSQLLFEKSKEKYPDWLTGSRHRNHDIDDKGDREMDRD